MKLKNKVVLVLGAVKGIGRGIGLDLAGRGCNVALTYFDWEESLAEMKAAFARTGQDHLIVKVNLLHTEKIRGWNLLTAEQKDAILKHTLIERTGTIDDVIKAVRFKGRALYDRQCPAPGRRVCAGRGKGRAHAGRGYLVYGRNLFI